ncbi:MAG: AraC family transcriptional regulator [Spirochaetales bacterium]|nr:AraC family transcriptional regulator [Spirochaetales bacterium]
MHEKHKLGTILRPSRTRYKKKTFLRIFAYSLIVCLVVLLLTVTAMYYSFSRIVTAEIHNKSLELLGQTRMVFNSLHAWIIPSFRQIKSEELVSSLIYSAERENLQISRGLDRLDMVMSAYYLLHSIYIYNEQNGHYFSTINGSEGQECSDITLPAIIHNIREYGVYRYIPRKIIYTLNSNIFDASPNEVRKENVFSILIGDMPDKGDTINGALVVNISEKKIRENFLGINPGPGENLLVIDKNGIVVTHPDEHEFGKDYTSFSYIRKILGSEKDEGIFTDIVNNRKYLISYITNTGTDWRFINSMPYGMIFTNLNTLLKTAATVFVALMLLAFFLTFFGSLRIYSPIKRLFSYSQSLKDRQLTGIDTDNTGKLSELQAFDRTFRQIVKKVQDADLHLDDYRELSKAEIIRNLLLGEMGLDEVQKHMDLVNTVLDRGPYLLAVIRIDNFAALQETLSREDMSRFFTILRELLFHTISFAHYFLQMRNDTACIVGNFRGSTGGDSMEMSGIVSQFRSLQAGLKKRAGRTISVGIGSGFSDLTDFPLQYEKVFRSTLYRFCFGHDSILHPDDISGHEKTKYLLPENDITRLVRELVQGKAADAEKILTGILAEVRKCKYEDFNYLRHFLLYRVRKAIEELKGRLASSYIKLNELVEVIEGLETLDDTRKVFSEIFSYMAESLQNSTNSKTRELADKIKKQIDLNYRDGSICAESIADQLGFSTQYIRFTFRNIYEVSIMDYINTLRLDYCRKQLVETRLPLRKIFQNAGYYNYSYSFTLFKKATGLTPNQFRLQTR